MAAKPMDDVAFKALIHSHIQSAVGGTTGGTLQADRLDSQKLYDGDDDVGELGNVPEGRSKMVSTDVRDTIEWILPSLLRIFTAGEKVAQFEPEGEEDIEASEQETDYINHIATRKNDAFMSLYTWFKDALMYKNGFLKAWPDDSEEEERESYEGLSDAEFQFLIGDDEVEVVAHTERAGVGHNLPPELMMGLSTAEHDVTVKRVKKKTRIRMMPLPGEEVLIITRARSIPDASFVAHRTKKRAYELIDMGLTQDEVDAIPSFTENEFGEERTQRFRGVEDGSHRPPQQDETMREIWVTECYIRCDRDGDGKPELIKATVAGNYANHIIDEEVFNGSRAPIYTITPVPMQHRIWGKSIPDMIGELQVLKSVLWRNYLDNIYAATNLWVELPETAIGDDTIDDLLTSRPVRIVRTKAAGQMQVIEPPVAATGATILAAIEYTDTQKEERTGVTRYNQGLDANTLNKTATGVQQIQAAAQQRIELIARVFAETGVKELFLGIHELIRKHSQREEIIKLRNKWVPIDPRQWKKRTDLSVTVGLGTGNKDQMLMHLMTILQIQREIIAFQGGLNGPLVTAKNLHNTLSRIVENAGLKEASIYFTDAEMGMMQPQQQPPDPRLVEVQLKAQIKEQEIKLNHATKMLELQMENQRAVAEAQMENERELREMALEDRRENREMTLEDSRERDDIARADARQRVADRAKAQQPAQR